MDKDQLASWLYLSLTVFAMLPVYGVLLCFGIFHTIFIEYYEESNSKAGWIGSVLFFMMNFGFSGVVYLRRVFGLRRVIFFSSGLVIFSFLSTPFMPRLDYLFITYSVPLGIAASFFDCFTTITLREYFHRFLGLAMGIRFAAAASGAMIFSYILPFAIDALGWKRTMMSLSSLALAFIVYAMAYRSQEGSRKKLSNESLSLPEDQKVDIIVNISQKFKMIFVLLQKKSFLLVLIGSLMFATINVVPPMFMIQYVKTLGYPLSKAKWLSFVYSLSSLVGRVVIGRIADVAIRYNKVKYITPSVITLFGIASGLCAFTQFLPLMALYMGVIGCLDGMMWVTLPLMVTQVTSVEITDTAYALLVAVLAFGYLVGPPAMGWLYDVTDHFPNVLYAVFACAVMAGIVMMLGACGTSAEDELTLVAELTVETAEKNAVAEKKNLDSLILNNLNNGSLSEETAVPVPKIRQLMFMVQKETSV